MRDPLAPIPSREHDPGFWRCTWTPRQTRLQPPPTLTILRRPRSADARAPVNPITSYGEAARFDPLRLLRRNIGDTHGLDRRTRRRSHVQSVLRGDSPHTGCADPSTFADPDDDDGRRGSRIGDPTTHILSSGHHRLDQIFGLCTAHGWALVHVLSAARTGLLVHLLDLLDPALEPSVRARGRDTLKRLVVALGNSLHPGAVHPPGSMLGLVGGCLLASRVVADLSSWASHPEARRGKSAERPESHSVTLFACRDSLALARRDLDDEQRALARQCAVPQFPDVLRFTGELVPMTDPQPSVLAIALAPELLTLLDERHAA